MGYAPTMSGVKDLVLAPETGEENRHAAQGHHTDSIGGEGQRHEFAQPAHGADILLLMAAVNDGTGPHEKQGLEEGVGDEMEHAYRHAAHTEAQHHEPEL